MKKETTQKEVTKVVKITPRVRETIISLTQQINAFTAQRDEVINLFLDALDINIEGNYSIDPNIETLTYKEKNQDEEATKEPNTEEIATE